MSITRLSGPEDAALLEPDQDELRRDGREQDAEDACDDIHSRRPEPALDASRDEKRKEGQQHDGSDDEEEERRVHKAVASLGGLHHDGRDSSMRRIPPPTRTAARPMPMT